MTTSTGDRTSEAVQQELLSFLSEHTRTTWAPDTDLFAQGGVSSLFAMQLLVHIESTYGISITGDDLNLDNFRTVQRMTALVERLRGEGSDG
ncbi:methoxymalonate biosynthesis acyl carrier protein [Micromonospora luteifusca]|uniref:Methoxymalonate biosynthesis acyl carrier protein n=1 Tax=Micromonospora luteifusca TaxID=709860 RepID=A0ABS2LMG0_9ACTN|nr:phosphopantetheine-binding protein [Micromonospora luteifusca]MBM7489377.1 methoxymalonate biosynthesis acyl carrier protein [Micromonospora luteifusca]